MRYLLLASYFCGEGKGNFRIGGKERDNTNVKCDGRNDMHSKMARLETYLIPGETLIPGGKGKRFTLVLDMPHI